MKNFSKGLLLFAVAASSGFVSCSDESPWRGSGSEGGINLNFSSDSRVIRQTRADDTVSPVVPDGNQFAVNLTKSDGSYSKDWNSVEAFNRETSFPIGEYSLSASFGDIDSEGFTNPYYKGKTDVHVSPGAVTDATVVATLANAMVSVRYTDEFKSNFAAYSTSVQTEGHQWVVFAQDEERPAYIAPSEVKLDLKLTNDAGKVVNIQPASFTALARHHYVVTIGVKADSATGDVVLDIQFDDDVVAETVAVSLGNELFNAPAPSVKTKGFESGKSLNAYEYAAFSGDAQFDVFAFGGLKSANINIISDNGYTPAFGRSAQLVNADALLQAQLASEGLDCAGFFRNVDKMGVVKLGGFISRLPAGSYTVELQVVDAMTRASEPVALSVSVTPVELEVESNVAPEFLGKELSIDVATNCADIRDAVSFKVPNANNQLVDAVIKSVTAVGSSSGKVTRSSLPYVYRYELEVATITRTTLNIETILGKRTVRTAVTVRDPEFTVTPDAFARKVVLKIEADSDEAVKYISDNVQLYNGEAPVPTASIAHADGGFVTVSGLTPATVYSDFNVRLGEYRQAVTAFTTETETDVPNGNFAQLVETVNYSLINAGGAYKYMLTGYQNKSTILASEPAGWASLNAKSCYSGAQVRNTWFMVPSTLASAGSVLIRSVAYDHNGKLPAEDNHGGGVRNKYSRNAPSALSSKTSGELFLGSYSYDGGSESRNEGMTFASRPSSVSFDYRYAPVAGEKGEMTVAVLDESGKVLASGSVDIAQADNTETSTVNLNYQFADFGRKARTLRIGFRSTKGSSVTVPIPTDLDDVGKSTPNKASWGWGYEIGANQYKSLCVGSQLWISNVRLGYGDAANIRAPRKSNGKRR